jgi:hypothetical protein
MGGEVTRNCCFANRQISRPGQAAIFYFEAEPKPVGIRLRVFERRGHRDVDVGTHLTLRVFFDGQDLRSRHCDCACGDDGTHNRNRKSKAVVAIPPRWTCCRFHCIEPRARCLGRDFSVVSSTTFTSTGGWTRRVYRASNRRIEDAPRHHHARRPTPCDALALVELRALPAPHAAGVRRRGHPLGPRRVERRAARASALHRLRKRGREDPASWVGLAPTSASCRSRANGPRSGLLTLRITLSDVCR